MGGSGSVPLPRYSCCIRQQNPNRCKENHSSTPKGKGHRRNLSAAFNMADLANEDISVEKIDINRASEEELMTLPGINRSTARNIVEYRRQLGGFKKVEDLALVCGVGATKLTAIRLEICVSRKKSSQSSSPYSSKVDLSLQDDVSRASSQARPNYNSRVNVNSANVFQLMRVRGVTQILAENIVAYRDKKGRYRNLDDLVKVKGVKPAVLSAIRPYLSLTDLHGDQPYINGSVPNGRTNKHVRSASHAPMSTCPPPPTQSAKPASMYGGSQDDLISLYGPLARKSFRRQKRPVVLRRDSRPLVRLGSWNLQRCGQEKAENPGVKEVVAMTILENGLSIVAFQNLTHPEALSKLCEELNAPSTPNVKRWGEQLGGWRAVTSAPVGGERAAGGDSSAHVGFLFDAGRGGVECRSVTVVDCLETRGRLLERRPCVAVFKVKDWEVAVVCIDWEPHQQDTVLDDVIAAAHEQVQGHKDVIVVGSFHMEPTAKEFDTLRHLNYTSVLTRDEYTDVSTRNPEGTACTCHVWLSSGATRRYSEQHAVVRDGLTSPWIPDGWGWGGVVSKYCPLWAEFYTDAAPQEAGGSTDDDDDDFEDAQEKFS